MKEMRIAICDDDRNLLPFLRKNILSCFEHYKTEVTLDSYQDGLELRRAVSRGTYYDVIFLDIDMPNCDGVEIGRHLMQILPSSCLIFVSNMEDHVYRSFSAQPFRFIRKEHFTEEIPEAVHAVLQRLNAPDTHDIVITYGSKTLRINPYRIVYAESCNNNITIFTENEQHTLRYTLSALEEQLRDYGFIRTHKGFLVNYRYIYRIEKDRAILDNKIEIPVSRSCLKSARETFHKLLTGE